MTTDPRCSAPHHHRRTPAPAWLATAGHAGGRRPARHRSTAPAPPRIPTQRATEVPPAALAAALLAALPANPRPIAADEPPAGLGPWVPPLPDPGRPLGRRVVAGLAAATLLMVVGIAAAGSYALHASSFPGSDSRFLGGVRGSSTLTSDDGALLAAGATVCPALDRHPSVAGVVGLLLTVSTSTGWSTDDSGAVVASAVRAYCPAHLDLLGG